MRFGPVLSHMNRDRAATNGSGTLMARNDVVGSGNSAMGIHVKLLQRVKHHNGAN